MDVGESGGGVEAVKPARGARWGGKGIEGLGGLKKEAEEAAVGADPCREGGREYFLQLSKRSKDRGAGQGEGGAEHAAIGGLARPGVVVDQ